MSYLLKTLSSSYRIQRSQSEKLQRLQMVSYKGCNDNILVHLKLDVCIQMNIGFYERTMTMVQGYFGYQVVLDIGARAFLLTFAN